MDWITAKQIFHLISTEKLIVKWVPGTNFINDFSAQFEFDEKLFSSQLLVIIWLQNSAHATTAKLSCHVQKFMVIGLIGFGGYQSHLNYDGKIICEMDPCTLCINVNCIAQPQHGLLDSWGSPSPSSSSGVGWSCQAVDNIMIIYIIQWTPDFVWRPSW